MKCVICKNGETRSGAVTVALERGGGTVVIKDVPAEICGNCGEYYLSEERTAEVMGLAEEAEKRGAEIEVLRYRPASARLRWRYRRCHFRPAGVNAARGTEITLTDRGSEAELPVTGP